jgi:hypothetical protein
MKKLLTTLLTASTLIIGSVLADTLELADGTLLEGSFVGSRSAARTGAAVGLGASLLTSGQSINIPAGTILETRLRVALTVPR